MGRDRALAIAAFLLLALALWTPWWGITYRDAAGNAYDEQGYTLWRDRAEVWSPAVWASAVAVVAATGLLLVRLAAASRRHEPRAWRRDLWVAAALAGLAGLVALAWPQEVPSFWGGRTFAVEGSTFTEHTGPRIGWWCTILATIAAAWAGWEARRQPADPAERFTPTTDK